MALPESEMRRAVNAVPPALFRTVMSRFATGVTVVTTDVGGTAPWQENLQPMVLVPHRALGM